VAQFGNHRADSPLGQIHRKRQSDRTSANDQHLSLNRISHEAHTF
jgi:hypothetical protein